MSYIANGLIAQNKVLQRQVKEKMDDMQFYNTKTSYREQQISTIQRINYGLYMIYHFLLLLGIIFSFFSLQQIKELLWSTGRIQHGGYKHKKSYKGGNKTFGWIQNIIGGPNGSNGGPNGGPNNGGPAAPSIIASSSQPSIASLFSSNSTLTLSNRMKFILLLSFIIYPYVIGMIENNIYFVIRLCYNIVLGDAFSKINRNNPLYNYNTNL
jgi:hypothetical protein